MRIDYHPAIAEELEEIRDHYEACSPGLGSDFVDDQKIGKLFQRLGNSLRFARDGLGRVYRKAAKLTKGRKDFRSEAGG